MEDLLARLAPVLQAWWYPIQVLFYFVGAAFVIMGLSDFANPLSSNRRGRVVAKIFAGILLLNLPTLMDTLSMTFFNASSEQALSYAAPSHPGSSYVQIAVFATMSIGLVSIGRACMFLRASNQGEPQVGRATAHFVGGILAVNIVQFLHLIGTTFGGEVESTINFVIG